jgi:hypothetical protein
MTPNPLIRDLGDGLILRHATPDDADALADFNGRIHSDFEGELDHGVIAWTRDLLLKPHPTFSPGDFILVEDTRAGKIVSAMNLISQTWAYEGIPFGVGRPELVGTDLAYRNRGLVRIQFEEVHRWSAARGELVQAITGIPYYYRLFGYEMTLNLSGGRAGFAPQVPELAQGQSEPYLLRPAQEADIPLLSRLYDQAASRAPVHVLRDEALWRYELGGKSAGNGSHVVMNIIETAAGEAVGILGHPPVRWNTLMPAQVYELLPGISWAAVTPSVIRFLRRTGEQLKPFHGDNPWQSFGFWLGEVHPVYAVFKDHLPRIRKPYAWYIRVPDLPGFIRHIAPALEQRLAASALVGYSGELTISFYRDGLKLVFENGRLAVVEPYRPTPVGHAGKALFPGLTFLQLLFNYRSLEELRYAFADVGVDSDEIAALLDALFPRKPSDLWPVA